MKIRNPTSEIRNKFEIQISNVQNSMDSGVLNIAFLVFGFVSDFGFRISNLEPEGGAQ